MRIELKDAPSNPSIHGAKTASPRDRAVAAYAAANQAAPEVQPQRLTPEVIQEVTGQQTGAPPAPETENRHNESSEDPSAEKPEAETKAPDEPISSQYAVLARKEKAIRQREQQLKARESALKSQEDASKAPSTPTKPEFDPSKYVDRDRLTQDPFSVLGELGLSYDQLTELAMNAPKPEQIALNNELKLLRDEIKALKGDSENTRKSFEEQQKQQYDQAVNEIRREVKGLTDSNPEFETIKETGSMEDVVELIQQTYKKDGILMTVEEAAQQVESYLVEEALKIARIKKIQQRLAPKQESIPGTQKPNSQPQQQQLKTLTNSVSTSRQLSARERAILAMQGKSK